MAGFMAKQELTSVLLDSDPRFPPPPGILKKPVAKVCESGHLFCTVYANIRFEELTSFTLIISIPVFKYALTRSITSKINQLMQIILICFTQYCLS